MTANPVRSTPINDASALRKVLVDAHDHLRTALDATESASAWDRVGPNNEGWNVRQLLVHLTTAESGFAATAERMARGEGAMPPDFDPNRWNAGQQRRQAEASVRELRRALDRSHTAVLALLGRVDAGTLQHQRGFLSTGEEGSLADLLRLLASHKRTHTGDIEAALATLQAASS